MLRAVLTHAGGVRIDHAFGLERLWVVPEGWSAAQGAYLSYPVSDLLRLVTLEASRGRHRHCRGSGHPSTRLYRGDRGARHGGHARLVVRAR
jgi:hypothetical protein